MSSGQHKLRATVQELERELAAAHHLDAKSRELLRQAASDIHAVLERHGAASRSARSTEAESTEAESTEAESTEAESAAGPAASAGGGSLVDRMNEAARRFEASHPLLSGILEQIAESLGQMGI
jgi:septal ring factor EnvC (AmiA/AmiB activator)